MRSSCFQFSIVIEPMIEDLIHSVFPQALNKVLPGVSFDDVKVIAIDDVSLDPLPDRPKLQKVVFDHLCNTDLLRGFNRDLYEQRLYSCKPIGRCRSIGNVIDGTQNVRNRHDRRHFGHSRSQKQR